MQLVLLFSPKPVGKETFLEVSSPLMRCSAMQCYAGECSAVLYSAVCTVQCALQFKGELTSKNVSFSTDLVEKSKTNCIFHLVG